MLYSYKSCQKKIAIGETKVTWLSFYDIWWILEDANIPWFVVKVKVRRSSSTLQVTRLHCCTQGIFLNSSYTPWDKIINKTWSSVSNSSLSKTFALSSLQNLKFRTSVSSLQRSFSLKFIFGQTKFLGLKRFWFPEKCLAKKKPCVWKNSRSQKVSGRKKILGPKKILGLKKNSWSKKNFGSKKNLSSEKNFGSEKNSWSKKNFGSKKNLGPKKM